MSKLEIFIWLNTLISIIGTFLNAKKFRIGFLLWIATDIIFVFYNIYLKSYPQSALFLVYLSIAIYGWFHWGKKPHNDNKGG
ncbi:MAG: nicotinamide mononucleotide transporter [Chlamydiae bacterium]|nr:nicotinamide mononucleotide transporter [Chlamydiota bacterium]